MGWQVEFYLPQIEMEEWVIETITEKKKSRVIDELRKNLYQLHGYECPEESLYMNDAAVDKKKQSERSIARYIDYIEKNPEKFFEEKNITDLQPQIIETVGSNQIIFVDALCKIGFYITILSNRNATELDIDRILSSEYILYELPDVLDLIFALSVQSLFMIKDSFDESMTVVNDLQKLFEITVNMLLSSLEESDACGVEKIHEETGNEFELDTSQLEIGQVVKNYKELCIILNQLPTTGKSKQLQLKDFQRYFEWEKSGQKFIITDIYDTPLEKEDMRKKGNNSIYVKYIELILLQFLSKQKNGTRTFKKRDWWQLLGMVNNKYNKVPQKELEKIDYVITSFEIKHFYQRCNKKLEQVLFSALNNLQNRKLITYELQTVIVDNDNNYFCADDNDKRKILQAERHVLHNVMGFEKIIQVFCRFKQDEYYRMVNERLSELYNWHFYYKQIKIIYTQKDVLEAIPQTEVNLQKEILNQKMIEVLNENAQKKFESEKEKLEAQCKNMLWGEHKRYNLGGTSVWEIPDTYLDAQRLLVNELICIGHKKKSFLPPIFEEDDEMNQIFNSFLH